MQCGVVFLNNTTYDQCICSVVSLISKIKHTCVHGCATPLNDACSYRIRLDEYTHIVRNMSQK